MRCFVAALSLLLWAAVPALRSATNTDYHVARGLNLQGKGGTLPCTVLSYPPELGFDFRFHERYTIIIRRKDVLKAGDTLSITLRVSPADAPESIVDIAEQFLIPRAHQSPEGELALEGSFLLGRGQYQVDWLMRDAADRVCAKSWDVETRITGSDTILEAVVPKDFIQPIEPTPFVDRFPLSPRLPNPPLRVKIIVNFAPRDPGKTTLDQHDVENLALILRAIQREPRITTFSVIACSLRTQQILYSSRNTPDIDLPALGAGLAGIRLGVIDAKALAVKDREAEFLKTLITEEMRDADYDALIFVGPKYPLKMNIPHASVDGLKGSARPLFYLNYESDPSSYPWRDGIGRFVKMLHGREYHISHPRDLFGAWSDLVSRIGPPARQYDYTASLP